MQLSEICKWAKDFSIELKSGTPPLEVAVDRHYRLDPFTLARWIDFILLPKLEEALHTSSNTQSTKRKKVSKV